MVRVEKACRRGKAGPICRFLKVGRRDNQGVTGETVGRVSILKKEPTRNILKKGSPEADEREEERKSSLLGNSIYTNQSYNYQLGHGGHRVNESFEKKGGRCESPVCGRETITHRRYREEWKARLSASIRDRYSRSPGHAGSIRERASPQEGGC